MKFCLYPKTEFELDIMLDILSSENIIYQIKTDREFMPFVYFEEKCITFDCDYNKFSFVRYLLDKDLKAEENRLKLAYRLEKCAKKENIMCTTEKLPMFTILMDDSIFEPKKKKQKYSTLYSLWKKLFNK